MALHSDYDDIVPLMDAHQQSVEIHENEVRIHDVTVARAAVAGYLSALSAAKRELALIHALELGVAEILARRRAARG